ncbi:MAG: HNH endonuclease [Actinomycetota bacterium]|nr:HNH endonuclease [Actinomycetota bacterium]
MTSAADKPEMASEDISPEERLRLWVRAGARCAMCNDYLLEHEYTALNVHTGEMAHIVGRAKSSRSPRGQTDLPVTERNLADNLVLLCPTDHTTIDKKLGQKVWTVENLQELKRRHEDRVHYLTGLGEDAETVVIRAIGGIRSGDVSVEPEAVRKAVFARQRYPRYELGARSGSDIEVDFRRLPAEGAEAYWETARQMLADTGTKLADGIRRGHVRHVSVFGFTRIPLLVLLGDQLDDKFPTDLYEHHRDGLGWRWADDEQPVSFRFERVAGEAGAQVVTLVCSISGSVPLDRLPAGTTAGAVYELRPADADPLTDLIRVPETLAAFSATYRAFLASIEGEHPNAKVLHVLGALPLTAAIELGRRRTRDVHPPLRVWDRNRDGEYMFAVEVGS